MRLIPILLAAVLPLAAQAAPQLPDTLLQAIKADPAAYLQRVSGLIASYGTEGAITAEQVDTSMALARAKARTMALLPLMRADLDGDGTLSREELGLAQAAVGASARARMERAFAAADADGSGMVTGDELQAYGALAALAAFSPAQMSRLKVLIGFDADGDGKVTLDEVRAGLAGVVS